MFFEPLVTGVTGGVIEGAACAAEGFIMKMWRILLIVLAGAIMAGCVYGDLHKKINSRFIGIIAAQTLGERSTQLVLRTFHTSGSAIIKGDQSETKGAIEQKDIIGDLSAVASLLHKFKGKTYTDIVNDLFDVYDKDIYHVHFECVVAQLMWKDYKKWRLLEHRDQIKPNYYSIQSVPNQESWILAMAFSNPKRSILQGILYEGRYSGVMDKILLGERVI